MARETELLNRFHWLAPGSGCDPPGAAARAIVGESGIQIRNSLLRANEIEAQEMNDASPGNNRQRKNQLAPSFRNAGSDRGTLFVKKDGRKLKHI